MSADDYHRLTLRDSITTTYHDIPPSLHPLLRTIHYIPSSSSSNSCHHDLNASPSSSSLSNEVYYESMPSSSITGLASSTTPHKKKRDTPPIVLSPSPSCPSISIRPPIPYSSTLSAHHNSADMVSLCSDISSVRLTCQEPGFTIESPIHYIKNKNKENEKMATMVNNINRVEVNVEFPEYDTMDYALRFLPNEHHNFIGEDENNRLVAVSVVLESSPSSSSLSSSLSSSSSSCGSSSSGTGGGGGGGVIYRVIVRTDEKDENVEITAPNNNHNLRRSLSKQDIINALKPRVTLRRLMRTTSQRVRENLVIMEKSQCIQKYKFGIVYCAEYQTTEDDMFSNEKGSVHFEKFMKTMGAKIPLKGWKGYAGGLDVKYDSTGSHSLFCCWQNFQIMFHVSTMLPFDPSDIQKLERKRHIGNDIAIIVFKDPNAPPYHPLTITSHFIHVILVIEPVIVGGHSFYRLEAISKKEVPTYGPQLTQPLFAPDEYFRNFVLAKLINGERASYHAPEFRPKIARTRSQILQDCADASKKPNKGQGSSKLSSSDGIVSDIRRSVGIFTQKILFLI
eukprot:TRINITY_DN6142_c0_g1_i2.p1 TRINITY_DN6142_c0_g1~~TRINITY_DN6142_c0_g1_i2.p1  ORF type:complete len:565 (-),score=187.79 TRINITY_DN6142_c0_g1_i2:120-1814(-)